MEKSAFLSARIASPIRQFGRPFAALLAAILVSGCQEPIESPLGEERPLATALATLPPSFQEVVLTSSLINPTAMAMAPDGRIFVCEKGGRLRVVKNGALLPSPFVTVNVSNVGERGLIGVAIDPSFAGNRWVYVHYTTASSPNRNRVSRFTASAANPDLAEAGSETAILDLDGLTSATNHNGGAIHFGSDGRLYVGVGDNNQSSNSQSLSTRLGKLLRINKDGSIPSDNPFYNATTGANRAIWALGIRNPFNFAVQPGTGRIFANDVGEDTWEEVNEILRGANYGWPASSGPVNNPSHTAPFHHYANAGSDCAVTGAAFYNPATPTFPSEYHGDYFFGDYCGGWVKRVDLGTRSVSTFLTGAAGLVDLLVEPQGSLYYLVIGGGNNGRLVKVSYSGGGQAPPAITQQPAGTTVPAGGTAAFTAAASGTSPLAWQWQKNGTAISGATSASYTTPPAQASDSGARFRCVVTNPHGTATSDEAVLTVTSNQPPTAAILAPAEGALYQGGQTIAYSGSGSDPQDGDLPASAFTWQVDFHHDTHVHPHIPAISGSRSGSFAVPTQGETSSNVWYRIHLTVRDDGGLAHQTYRDVQPQKVSHTLATSPAGLQLLLDGQAVTSPFAFTAVVGMQRTLEAPTPQVSAGKNWDFAAWSDGGGRSHVITVPASAAAYTATFTEAVAPPSQVYEAEDAAASGPLFGTYVPGFTGRGFMDYINWNNDYLEYTVTAPAAGNYTLEFRYADGGMHRRMDVSVNGVVIHASEVFPMTGSYRTWGKKVLAAALGAGANRIRLSATLESGGLHDHLKVY